MGKKRTLVHIYVSSFVVADILGEVEFSKLEYKMPVFQVPRKASNLTHSEGLILFSTMLKDGEVAESHHWPLTLSVLDCLPCQGTTQDISNAQMHKTQHLSLWSAPFVKGDGHTSQQVVGTHTREPADEREQARLSEVSLPHPQSFEG